MISASLYLIAVWSWAIWAAAEHWLGNPNYSYGWAVPLLMCGFAVRRYLKFPKVIGAEDAPVRVPVALAAIIALLVFALECAREQIWHPVIVIWTIGLFAVGSTIAVLGRIGGRAFARTEIFPIAFFMTALPWPPRIEQPLTSALMRSVALITTEVLHWLGIQAQAAGGAIALRDGLVGITEACSGIRSLQTSVMFGLAIGEWFLLTTPRRIFLLATAIALALITNLARTLTLTLQAHARGIDSVDRVHDLVGNIIITALVLTIWFAGKLLSTRSTSTALVARIRRSQPMAAATTFAPSTIAIVVGLIAARLTTAHIEAGDKTQTAPFFTAKIDGLTNRVGDIPKEVWRELHPSSGEYVRHANVDLAGGRADCFHFFWKPSPWNRFALVHRPDICMPGIGWQLDGPPETHDVDLSGRALRFYAFRFHRDNVHALELWGAWRNGEPVPIDYRPDQVLGVAAAPASMQLEGKRKSATEIVSCSVISEDRQPEVEKAAAVLRNLFDFHPR